jgi:hypothetical protein
MRDQDWGASMSWEKTATPQEIVMPSLADAQLSPPGLLRGRWGNRNARRASMGI